VVDAVLGAALVEGVAEDVLDHQGRLIDQAVEEGPSLSGRFFGQEFDIHPARGPINGHEQVLMRGFIAHPRQVVHIDMDKPWGINFLKGLYGLGFPFWLGDQGSQVRHPMTAQTPIETRTRHLRMDELSGDGQQIIQRQ